jgi:chromosome segregation ATPase
MTIDEMAKLEQEHKDRIVNMTAEYENGFNARTATFMEETKRLGAEIETRQIELRSLVSEVNKTSASKTALDVVIESLNREIKEKTAENLDLIEKNAESAAAFSTQRQREEETLREMETRLESVVAEISTATETVKGLEVVIAAKQDEAKAKGTEVAGYLSELTTTVKEATAKKDAVLAEVDDLIARKSNLVDSVQAARTDLDAINQKIESATVDLTRAESDLSAQKALYTENLAQFKNLSAMRSDVESKQLDVKFREEQLIKRAKTLNEQEARIKQMQG